MPTLYDPLTVGALTLRNRIIMAPLTRARAGSVRIPNGLMAQYYRQRASAGLIISEATAVTPMGVGYADTPGIWSDQHVAGWRMVTDAVHQEGGLIFMQLWHVGRISDPSFLDGRLPVAPSAIAAPGMVNILRPQRPFVTPRALDTEEIPAIVEAYRQGAIRAQKAGFDGVELHGANGYLLDQFLQDVTNRRTDLYGGAIANRARLMLEAVDAAISVWGADRVGLHLSPVGKAHGMGDSDPAATFGAVAAAMAERKIAFICGREARQPDWLAPRLKSIFGGVYFVNEGFTGDSAEAVVQSGEADAVVFGKLFIANPDLPHRLRQGSPLNEPIPESFYAEGPVGYVDYPRLAAA